MPNWLSRLTLNQRLAALAFVLGAGALAATPIRTGSVRIDPEELALAVQNESDHIGVRELADRLIGGRADLRLVDLRDEADYLAYHIPTAENIPLAALESAGLSRNESLLVYGEDGVHAAQAWFLLKARGFKGVRMLRGGMAEWREQVLFPILPEAATPERQRERDRIASVAAFFGGAPRQASAAGGPAPLVMMPEVPQASAASPRIEPPSPGARQKPAPKRKEGC